MSTNPNQTLCTNNKLGFSQVQDYTRQALNKTISKKSFSTFHVKQETNYRMQDIQHQDFAFIIFIIGTVPNSTRK